MSKKNSRSSSHHHTRRGPKSKPKKRRRPEIEIPPEIEAAWSEIDHPLVQAQTNLFINELREEKREDLTWATMGLLLPEEGKAELDKVNQELFEEVVEATFLAYRYERRCRRKQETPEFLWAVYWKGLVPLIRQREDPGKPLLKHWLARITVEAAGLGYGAKRRSAPDSQTVKPSEKRPAEAELPERPQHGEFCNQIVSEIKRVKFMCGQGGKTVAEIKNEHPNLAVWDLVASLSGEDQETFKHPGRWGSTVGYAHLVLAKHFDRSPGTIKNWRKALSRQMRRQ